MRFETESGPVQAELARVIVAGWTGRNRAAVDHHIEELAALGVAPPSGVPLYYRAAPDVLTQGETITVLGENTSGEAEPFVLHAGGQLWLGLASDHTDRALEAHSVAASKQICAKPVAGALWAFDEVAAHLDQLHLSCEVFEAGAWVMYQNGTLADILPLPDLIAGAALSEGDAMLGGTLPAMGGVRPAAGYRMRLADPVRDRELRLDYGVKTLPIVA